VRERRGGPDGLAESGPAAGEAGINDPVAAGGATTCDPHYKRQPAIQALIPSL
jgi:hypothetical protein